MALAGTPLFMLQARQLTPTWGCCSDGRGAGALLRVAEPVDGGRAAWALLAGAGLTLAAATGGVLVGVVPPCLAFGAAWLLSGLPAPTRSLRVLTAGVGAAGLAFA